MAYPPFELPIAALTLEVVTSGGRTRSPYSFAQTAYDFMGGAWGATLDLTPLKERQRNEFLAWLASLDGQFGTFELPAPDYHGPFGSVVADTTVALSANARAKTLFVNVPVGQTFAVGDRFNVAGHNHVVTEVLDSVAGQKELKLWPRLRRDVLANDPVEVAAPYITWTLANARNGYGVTADLAVQRVA